MFRIIAPIRNDRVVLSGFRGSYSDNPKYICEKIHELKPDVELYWALGSSKTSSTVDIPEYVRILYTDKFRYYWVVNTARVLVDNYYGFFLSDYSNAIDRRMKDASPKCSIRIIA